MRNPLLALFLFVASLNLTGCVGFRANELPTVNFDNSQPPAEQKVKVYSKWHSDLSRNQWKTGHGTPNQYIQQRFDRALEESGCCTLVNDPKRADLVLHGTAYSDPNPAASIAGMISGATLLAIPCWGTGKVHLAATAKNASTERVYELRDSATMVVWLPLILAMPFSENPLKAEAEMDANAYRNLVSRLQQDGLLKVRTDAPPSLSGAPTDRGF